MSSRDHTNNENIQAKTRPCWKRSFLLLIPILFTVDCFWWPTALPLNNTTFSFFRGPSLFREKHIQFLKKGLSYLPSSLEVCIVFSFILYHLWWDRLIINSELYTFDLLFLKICMHKRYVEINIGQSTGKSPLKYCLFTLSHFWYGFSSDCVCRPVPGPTIRTRAVSLSCCLGYSLLHMSFWLHFLSVDHLLLPLSIITPAVSNHSSYY